jgi:hypothetical protein
MSRTDDRNKVRVGTMVGFAYRNVFGRLGLVLDLGWPMLLALMAVLILPGVLLPDQHVGGALRLDTLDYAQAVVALLSLSAFAVRWHQSILVGDPHRQPPRAFFRAWLRFLGYGCICYFVIGVVAASTLLLVSRVATGEAAAGAVELGAIVVGILLAVALLRFAMLFPAAAAGAPLGAAAAWRLMRRNTWRLVLASILTAVPVTFTAGFLTLIVIAVALPGGPESPVPPPLGFAILTGLIETAANILLVALGASLLSGFYRALMARRLVQQASDQR